MLDEKIVEMYWSRSEDAITETSKKYGHYCHSIAYNILRNHADSEECVNDTYLSAWNSMPTKRPSKLGAFLAVITRNISLKKYNYYSAKKRGGTQVPLVLDELLDCVSGNDTTEDIIETMHFEKVLNDFLESLSEQSRNIFVCRYWHLLSVKEIAVKYKMTESNVKVSLHRARNALKIILEKEGIY